MTKIKTNKRTYLIGKIKDMTILNLNRKVLSITRTLGIIIGDIKGIILKIINSRILQQQNKVKHPLPLIKILQKGNP